MPVPITKYTCKFKCGARAQSKDTRMAAHEKACWNNPENKTCKTCSNEIYEKDSDDYTTWIDRGCKIYKLDEVLENLSQILKGRNNMHIRPIHNCEYHNRSEDENVAEFSKLIENEITANHIDGSLHFPYFNDTAIDIINEKISNG